MRCWKCDSEVADDARYCFECDLGVYPTPIRFGRYLVLRHLGSGSFGNVFEAFDPLIDRRVAVKKFSSPLGARDMVANEVRVLGRMDHPNIVKVFEVSEDEGFIVMEFVAGGSLENLMSTRPEWLRSNFTDFFVSVCEGLRAAHQVGIIHRDLKPANIFVTEEGIAKVGDFGVARILEKASMASTVAGSPPYMAPEVLLAQHYDASVDIHSLGCVMYESWSGVRPFSQPGSWDALAMQKLHPAFANLRDLDGATDDLLSELVSGMLAVPEQRLNSVEMVIEQLRQRRPGGAQLASLDDMQVLLGGIYGFRNRYRSPLLLLAHLHAALNGVGGGMSHQDAEYGNARVRAYFPRMFAWLCALASSLNVRLSQLIWLKFDGVCPYCDSEVCRCGNEPRTRDSVRNRDLLARVMEKSLPEAPPSETFLQYQAIFRRIYGATNQANGLAVVERHAHREVAEANDALLHLTSLTAKQELGILHLELSDLIAWFFALLNMYDNNEYNFVEEFKRLFGRGCYDCHATPCVCADIDSELRMANWRYFA